VRDQQRAAHEIAQPAQVTLDHREVALHDVAAGELAAHGLDGCLDDGQRVPRLVGERRQEDPDRRLAFVAGQLGVGAAAVALRAEHADEADAADQAADRHASGTGRELDVEPALGAVAVELVLGERERHPEELRDRLAETVLARESEELAGGGIRVHRHLVERGGEDARR
jgi:hypothetical protein